MRSIALSSFSLCPLLSFCFSFYLSELNLAMEDGLCALDIFVVESAELILLSRLSWEDLLLFDKLSYFLESTLSAKEKRLSGRHNYNSLLI
jgi:hypothetical protein